MVMALMVSKVTFQKINDFLKILPIKKDASASFFIDALPSSIHQQLISLTTHASSFTNQKNIGLSSGKQAIAHNTRYLIDL